MQQWQYVRLLLGITIEAEGVHTVSREELYNGEPNFHHSIGLLARRKHPIHLPDHHLNYDILQRITSLLCRKLSVLACKRDNCPYTRAETNRQRGLVLPRKGTLAETVGHEYHLGCMKRSRLTEQDRAHLPNTAFKPNKLSGNRLCGDAMRVMTHYPPNCMMSNALLPHQDEPCITPVKPMGPL